MLYIRQLHAVELIQVVISFNAITHKTISFFNGTLGKYTCGGSSVDVAVKS